jgi:putative DNA primase/helicase
MSLNEERTKWGKFPVNIHNGYGASCTKLETLCTFEEARKAFEGKRYGLDGIGFSIHFSDVNFIDLDGCIPLEDGEALPWVRKFIPQINSYTECSVSGTGIHILYKGTAMPSVKTDKIEFYSTGRFVWITGRLYDLDASLWRDLRTVR